MGSSASHIGKTRLFLRSTALVPRDRLQGSVELALTRSLVPKSLIFTLQAREHTRWLESRTVYNPITRKNQRILVDVGDTKVDSLASQEVPVSYSSTHFAPGSYRFDFDLLVPVALKSGVNFLAGEAEGSFGYELKVNFTSDLGEHSSVMSLSGPKDTRIPTEEHSTMFSQGFGQVVTFKSLFKEAGSTQVYSKVLQSALVDSGPIDVVLDIDNSHNPVAVKSAYLSLLRQCTLKGQKDNYEHTEIVKTTELDGLPIPPKAFLQHIKAQIDPGSKLSPTFNGDLISNRYILKLNIGTAQLTSRAQAIDLSEIVVLSSETDQITSTEAVLAKESANSLSQWIKRTDWVDLAGRMALSLAIKLLEELLKGKRK